MPKLAFTMLVYFNEIGSGYVSKLCFLYCTYGCMFVLLNEPLNL